MTNSDGTREGKDATSIEYKKVQCEKLSTETVYKQLNADTSVALHESKDIVKVDTVSKHVIVNGAKTRKKLILKSSFFKFDILGESSKTFNRSDAAAGLAFTGSIFSFLPIVSAITNTAAHGSFLELSIIVTIVMALYSFIMLRTGVLAFKVHDSVALWKETKIATQQALGAWSKAADSSYVYAGHVREVSRRLNKAYQRKTNCRRSCTFCKNF